MFILPQTKIFVVGGGEPVNTIHCTQKWLTVEVIKVTKNGRGGSEQKINKIGSDYFQFG